MSKREASQIAAAAGLPVDADAPRAKRRKEAPATTTTNGASTAEELKKTVKDEVAGADLPKEDQAAVKERGLRLWQIVKDAVNKEGRTLSVDFMRLPSKRQYPDYYMQIKRPIALDDVKTRLDAGGYSSSLDVKEDLELCFKNAKKYNMRDSQIWKDAKHLHKLVTKEYAKMTGTVDHGEAGENGEDGGAARSGDEGEKKKKAPNMTRLLRSRLQKLVEKTDDNGRVVAAEFMDLPNRKQWPIYYKTIKRPMCFDMVFKHLKRKEYPTAQDFANNVELIFSNALEFNQEHTPIWEDAVTLRDTFRQLMSDLPTPYALPQYASDAPKIRLKMPGGAHSSSSHLVGPSSGNVLRIPPSYQTNGAPMAAKSPSMHPQTPAAVSALSPAAQSAAATSSTSPVPPSALVPVQTKSATPAVAPGVLQLQPPVYQQSMTYSATPTQHYPNAVYQQSAPVASTPLAPAPSSTPVAQSAVIEPPVAAAPAVVLQPASRASTQSRIRLKCAALTLKPIGRRLDLHYTEGVKTWAIRLGRDESLVHVSSVSILHLGQEAEESSGDEHLEAEEEEEQLEQPEPPKKRGRGRPRKNPPPDQDVSAKPSPGKTKGKGRVSEKLHVLEELELKLNGAIVQETYKGKWDVNPPIGLNTLEMGCKGGIPWRVYLDRPF